MNYVSGNAAQAGIGSINSLPYTGPSSLWQQAIEQTELDVYKRAFGDIPPTPKMHQSLSDERLLMARLMSAGLPKDHDIAHISVLRAYNTADLFVTMIVRGEVVSFRESNAMFPRDDLITKIMLAVG